MAYTIGEVVLIFEKHFTNLYLDDIELLCLLSMRRTSIFYLSDEWKWNRKRFYFLRLCHSQEFPRISQENEHW